MNREDLRLLKEILNRPVDPIKVKCNVLITSLWRTVIPFFTLLPDSCLRHLKTNKNFMPWNYVKKVLLYCFGEEERPLVKNGVQVKDPSERVSWTRFSFSSSCSRAADGEKGSVASGGHTATEAAWRVAGSLSVGHRQHWAVQLGASKDKVKFWLV